MRRKMQKKRVIALILEEMSADFSKELIRSTAKAIPQDEDIKLIVLAGKYIDVENNTQLQRNFKAVYNTVFKLDDLCDVDGMVIHLGSMSKRRKKIIRTGFTSRFQSIPKVFIASDMEGETVVNYDNESGIREAVDCLVNVEGLTNFCMLGGRDDNFDARLRKQIFIRCLAENNIFFTDECYEHTDMSERCIAEAEALLDRNPDVQAIFCVNDAVAVGLYEVMAKRELVPGKDIIVFGFDNTHMAGEMLPSLSSIGADNCTLGQRAVEVLLDKMNGREVRDTSIKTRLYGRDSFHYEMYDYTTLEMLKMDPSFIHRMFDDCFYRYRNANIDRSSVDLRRLFFEMVMRMMKSIKHRYMSNEDYQQLSRMIDIFFDENAMKYTDPTKLLQSAERLQSGMNFLQKSPAASIMINRLFSHIKERAIFALAEQHSLETAKSIEFGKKMEEFMLLGSAESRSHKNDVELLLRNADKFGVRNAAIFLYDQPLRYKFSKGISFPDTIRLRCVLRSGEVYLLPPERQSSSMRSMFTRNELPMKCQGFVALPVFFRDRLYGFMLCELSGDIYERGEYIALQLGRAIHIAEEEYSR